MNTILEIKLFDALKRIAAYQSPDRLRRSSEKDWGLPYAEALEMAYDNIQSDAKRAVHGVRVRRT